MKRFSILLLLSSVALVWIGCGGGDDNGPAGPTIDAPTTLTAVPVSESIIQLNWDDNTPLETGYRVYSGSGGNWAVIAELPANSRTYRHQGLSEGTAVSYRVKAFSFTSESGWSPTATAATMPRAPMQLSGRRLSGTSIELNWLDSSNVETGFEIQRKLRQDRDFNSIANTAANVVSFTDQGLTPNTTYNYRVRARRDADSSAWSATISAVTTIFTPVAPSNLTITNITANGCFLRWDDNSFNENGFVIELSMRADGGWSFRDSIKFRDTRQYAAAGLTSATNYWFRVFAYNDSGLSAASNAANMTTLPGPPVAPSNLRGEAPSYRVINLNWQDNSTDERGFILERKEPPGTFWTRLDSIAANVSGYVDSSVTRNKTYIYHVAAWSENGTSTWSNEVTVMTPDGPPNAPSRLGGQGIALDRIRLNWQDNSTNEEGFIVERKAPGENDFSPLNVTPQGFSSYTDIDLLPETEYVYRVKAFNARYESNYSNEAAVSTWSLTAHADNWENHQVDRPPSGPAYNITLAGNSRIVVTSDDRHEGQKSLKFLDPDDDGTSLAQLFTTFRTIEVGHLAMWLRMAPAGHFGVIGGDPNNTITFQIQFNNDNTYLVRNGAGLAEGGNSFPTNRWFLLEIDYNCITGLWGVKFDGEQVNNNLALQLGTGHQGTNQLVLTCFRNAVIPYVYMDEFLVRQIIPGGAPQPLPPQPKLSSVGAASILDVSRVMEAGE